MKHVAVFMTLVAVVVLSGCASAARPKAMIPIPSSSIHKSAADIVVLVIGGRETSAMAASQISNEDFAQAIRESFEQSGLFQKALSDGLAKYRLDAFITQVNQPMFGFAMTVSMEVNYTLARTAPQGVIWQKAISSSYTAAVSEAFVGVTRLRIANEGAARNNIDQAMEEISKLQLE
jgi:hypothetical protein